MLPSITTRCTVDVKRPLVHLQHPLCHACMHLLPPFEIRHACARVFSKVSQSPKRGKIRTPLHLRAFHAWQETELLIGDTCW